MDINDGLITNDLTPTARVLYSKYGTMLLNGQQTAEAIGLTPKTIRQVTTAQYSKGRIPQYLIKLRGTKVGRKRFWHIRIVADWIDQQELKAREAIGNETPRQRGRPRKIEQRM